MLDMILFKDLYSDKNTNYSGWLRVVRALPLGTNRSYRNTERLATSAISNTLSAYATILLNKLRSTLYPYSIDK